MISWKSKQELECGITDLIRVIHCLPVIKQAGQDHHGDVLGAVGTALHEPMPGLGEGFIQYSIELEINVIK